MFNADASDADLLAQIVRFYATRLHENPTALAFLEKIGLSSPEMLDRFQIGFSDRTLGKELPPKIVKAGRTIRTRITRLGIYRDNGREHLRGAIVFPVFDGAGDVTTLYGRMIGTLRPGTPYHLFAPAQPRGVFNIDGIASARTVIITDSIVSALSFWCSGFHNVTCTFGHDDFSDEHLTVLKAGGAEQVLVASKRAEAADKAAEALAQRLATEGITTFRVLFPAGQDANEFLLANKDRRAAFDLVLRSATWLAGTARSSEGRSVRPDVSPKRSVPEEATRRDAFECAVSSHGDDDTEDLQPNTHQDAQENQDDEFPILGSTDAAEEVSPLPRPPAPPEIATETSGDDELVIVLGNRRYRVRGLAKNTSFDVLKVNLLVSREGQFPDAAFHVDVLDLYQAKQRAAFQKQASIELSLPEEVIRHDLARVLFKLEELQEEHVRRLTAPKFHVAPPMGDADRDAALALLRDPRLLDRIVTDLERAGLVGEATNKLVAYLVAVSRLLDDPLALLVQSSSAAGKSTLTDAVLACVPPEERVSFSALTGQSLFYLGEHDLKHKVLSIAEEEGARRAAYALKLLQSERRLTIGSTDKDPVSGKLVTREYKVEGPVALALTTTRIDIDDELLNRCVVLTVDEDREQTRAIHRLQRERETLAGMEAKHERDRIVKLHQNAQRLLRPLLIANPHAPAMSFLDDRTRARRDQPKLLALIRTVALLHQYQREVKTTLLGGRAVEYIEATTGDVETATRLMRDVLGRDDMPPHTRKLLVTLDSMVAAGCQTNGIEWRDYRFTRRDLREFTGWGDTQLKVHLRRLVELEYLVVRHHAEQRRFVYELRELSAHDAHRAGQSEHRAGYGRPPVGVQGRPPNPTEPQDNDRDPIGRAAQSDPASQVAISASSYVSTHRSGTR